MFIARVVGNTWATCKHKRLAGSKLMLVRPVNPESGAFCGETTMALDGGFDAGPGDIVLILDEGGSARKILGQEKAPVRTLICGIVDHITYRGKEKKYA